MDKFLDFSNSNIVPRLEQIEMARNNFLIMSEPYFKRIDFIMSVCATPSIRIYPGMVAVFCNDIHPKAQMEINHCNEMIENIKIKIQSEILSY